MGVAGDETTMLTVTGSSISWVFIFALLFLLSSKISAPSSEVLQELVLTSEYSEGTALIGRGGFLGEELSKDNVKKSREFACPLKFIKLPMFFYIT